MGSPMNPYSNFTWSSSLAYQALPLRLFDCGGPEPAGLGQMDVRLLPDLIGSDSPEARDGESGHLRTVAVVGKLPIARKGLEVMLEGSGFCPVAPRNMGAWLSEAQRVVVAAVEQPEELVELLPRSGVRLQHLVVMVMRELSKSAIAKGVALGASSFLSFDIQPIELIGALVCITRGRSVVPTTFVESANLELECQIDLNDDNLELLRALASGKTVRSIAEAIAYSEREVYRLLRALYDRLGVANRTEALVWAARHGVLDGV